MSNYHTTPEGKDPHLWDIARRRSSFKTHLTTYLVMTLFFWAVWYFTGSRNYNNGGLPWPVWPMFGWGIGVAFHYMGAYVATKSDSTANEYKKLINEKSKNI